MKKFNIDVVTLENKKSIGRSKSLRRFGICGVCIGVICITVGEALNDLYSLKMNAVNNEAADVIGDLLDVWSEQNNIK